MRERKLVVCVSQKIFYAEVFKRLVYGFHQSLNIVEAAGIYKKIVCNGGVIAYDMLLKCRGQNIMVLYLLIRSLRLGSTFFVG